MPDNLTPYMDEKLKKLEDNMVKNFCRSGESSSVDEKIKYMKISIEYGEQLYSYCLSKRGYKKYLHDTWQHCLKDGGDYLKRSIAELKELELNYDEYKDQEALYSELLIKVLDHIKNNPGILQTDIYKHLGKEYQDMISGILYKYAKDNIIAREKKGRTYAVHYIQPIKIENKKHNQKSFVSKIASLFKR